MTATCDDQLQLKLNLAKTEPSTNGSTLLCFGSERGAYIGHRDEHAMFVVWIA